MSKRTNQEWLEQLRGDRGEARQAAAHEELATYLRKVAYHYLLQRQAKGNPYLLVTFASEALAGLAHDFAQDTLVKLANDDFALLDKYQARASFMSWTSKIVINEVRQELRRPRWNEGVMPSQNSQNGEGSEFELFMASEEMKPENVAIGVEVMEALKGCLGRLKEYQRRAFLGIEIEGRSGEELAALLNRPSKQAVYSLASRTRGKLRKCLELKGWERDVLEIFKK